MFIASLDQEPPARFGWASDCRFSIADFRFTRANKINRQSTIGNVETHPLPRGGTDLMTRECALPVLIEKTLAGNIV
jgi:hypothetical protein